MFDGVSLSDHAFHPSPSFPSLQLNQPSPGSTSSYNDRHLEPPQTYETVVSANTALKTRVSELEVINDLFRGRVTELEQNNAITQRGEMERRESNMQLHIALEESQRRESDLKRRVEELEREVSELRDGEPRAKRMRVSDMVDESTVSTPQSSS